MESMNEMIELQGVTFGYHSNAPIFDRFSWKAGKGEAWAILGSSGCGKSTLLYLLAGLLKPKAGLLRIGGEEIKRPRPRTGLILQDYGLLPWATVRDNITLGLRIRQFYGPDGRHAPKDELIDGVDAQGDAWLEKMGLKEAADRFPGQISGGQRQRTAIARTLALGPDLLLMDEPFSSLDAPTRESLQNIVMRLNKDAGLTTVVVTHSIDEAVMMGRQVLTLGSPPNREPFIFENPESGAVTGQRQELSDRLRQMLEEGK